MHGHIDAANNHIIVWHLFRETEQGRVACQVTVDTRTSTILSDKCDKATVEVKATHSNSASIHSRLGIPIETVERDGHSVQIAHPSKAPPSTRRLMHFFDESQPCGFAGCEELRAEYFKRLGELPTDCPPCRAGELMREYMTIILDNHAPAFNSIGTGT